MRVDDVPADAVVNKQLLELYFEKWGGPVEKISTNPEENSIIITFCSEDGTNRLLTLKTFRHSVHASVGESVLRLTLQLAEMNQRKERNKRGASP